MYSLTSITMSAATGLAHSAIQHLTQHSTSALIVSAGLAALGACGYYLSQRSPNPADLKTVRTLAGEIQDLKPVIGDGASYDFLGTHQKYIDDNRTKAGTLSMLAAGIKAAATGKSYGSPNDVLELGESLLRTKSGQCDHMAAAVIAKIVQHIRKGGAWKSKVELVGNGGHAFVIIGRKGSLNEPETWGKQTILVDSWLGRLGVNPKFSDQLKIGDQGVVSNFSEVVGNANFFGADRFKTTCEFSVEKLHELSHLAG